MRKLASLLIVSLMLLTQAWAQNKTVTGKVTGTNTIPLEGVTVSTSDGQIATRTNTSGNFTLTIPSGTKSLKFTFVGYIDQSVTLGNSNNLTISLVASNRDLDEVVVTGYTNKRRSEFTGSSSKVTAKQIEQIPLASFDQILQGRAPGLYIASGSGQPGASARVNIRGVSSLGGGSDPLYVVDGIPIEAGVFRTLNPNDFESVDVLKDASGASLYGSRGANGVIVITTKKGRPGKNIFQYRTQVGVNKAPKNTFEMMNTQQRLQFEEEFLGPAGVLATNAQGLTGYPGWDYSQNNPRYAGLSVTQRQVEAARLDSIRQINTNWQDVFFRDAKFQSHELNASGGSQNATYYTSLSYYKQEGSVIRSLLERYTYRGNVDIKADRLTVGVHTTAGWSKYSGIESEAGIALANPIAAAFLSLPYERLMLPNGRVNVGTGKTGPNAYDRLYTTTSVTNQFKGNISVSAAYDIWGGIAAKTTSGLDYRNNNSSRFIDPNSFAGTLVVPGGQGLYTEGNSEYLVLNTTSGLTFNRTFSKHGISAQAMMELVKAKGRNNSGTGYGLNLKLPNTPAAITQGSATNNFIPLFSGGKSSTAIFSMFALGEYNYDKKYFVSASIRRDAPSQVPIDNRNNIFWTVGGSWNIISENFMKNQNIFQELRLRGSYGSSANVNGFTSDFGYIASYGTGNYAGIPGILPSSPGNLGYKLESQNMADIGIEFSTWQRRVKVVVDVYNKESENLFLAQQLPRSTGFRSLNINAGKMRNRGLEFDVHADVVSTNDLLITVGGNVGFLQNRITDLGQITELAAGTGISRVGLPFGTHYAVGYLGVDPQTGNPIYQDLEGKPTSTYSATNSLATFGTYLPKYNGGADLTVRFKNFDLSTLFSFAQGVQRYNNESFFYEGGGGWQYNLSTELFNAWRTPGQVTDIQRIGAARQFSSRNINDASFIRWRNLQVGYTFNFKNSKPIRGIRVYGQAQNLKTWTDWRGFDPEESNNIATYEFPNPRSYTVGVDVNF